MTTEEKFNAAVNVIRSLPKNGSYQPSNELMLRFYSYFKQAKEGPCKGPRPPFWDPVGRIKYDSWKKLGDLSKTDAMRRYVDELHTIVETMSYSDNVANFLDAPMNDIDINMADLELIAGDVIEKVRSQPNSPFGSRDPSPHRLHSSLGSSPSVSPSPPTDSDHSDGEYVDTIEAPEPRKSIPNGAVHSVPMTNGYHPKEHKSRGKLKMPTQYEVDISREVSKAVQSLKSDIENLSSKINSLERIKNTAATTVVQKNRLPFGSSARLLAFLIIWPMVASFIVHRIMNRNRV